MVVRLLLLLLAPQLALQSWLGAVTHRRVDVQKVNAAARHTPKSVKDEA